MTDTLSALLDDLEAKAKAATPGEWRACRNGECPCGHIYGIPSDSHVATAVTRSHFPANDMEADELVSGSRAAQKANARHIAAANPAAILSLIAQVREVIESNIKLTAERNADCAAKYAIGVQLFTSRDVALEEAAACAENKFADSAWDPAIRAGSLGVATAIRAMKGTPT